MENFQQPKSKGSLAERASPKFDNKAELDKLELMLGELKVQFEQYFMGVRALPPDQLHKEVKVLIRKLMKSPFKNSSHKFKLRNLESRYHSFNSYWERVNRQREDGTYTRDIFKAELREKLAFDEAKAATPVGQASKAMTDLFNSYKEALVKQSGREQKLDFERFQKNLLDRAKELKAQHGVKKVSFKIKVKDGKVSVQAIGKN